MKDVTVFESSSSPDFVRFVLNTHHARRLCILVGAADTTTEVQTLNGYNFRAFENICWRDNITVADAR